MAKFSFSQLFTRRNRYPLCVLLILVVIYAFNSTDRFILGVTSAELAQTLKYGDLGCLKGEEANSSVGKGCKSRANRSQCELSQYCQWNYTGQGIEYQILAGPTFIVVFSISALIFGIAVEVKEFNRKNVLAVFAFLWSLVTLVMSFVTQYWQLVILRMALGLFESVCAPFGASLLADFFAKELRGASMGIFNWGIYIGFSLAFVFKFVLTELGWRWTFRMAGIPGCIMAIVLALAVKEPAKRKDALGESVRLSSNSRLFQLAKSFLSPGLLLLCVGGGIRNGGGLVLAYNVDTFFSQYRHAEAAHYMSWVPLVGGATGAALGGLVSDALLSRFGPQARIPVLILSQLLAAPLAFGVLLIPHPTAAFMCLLAAFFVGEMWIGVCLTVVVELRPKFPTGSASLYVFVIQLLGGNATLLVAPLSQLPGWDLRHAMLLLYPGFFALSAVVFAAAFWLISRSRQTIGRKEEMRDVLEEGGKEEDSGESGGDDELESEVALLPLLGDSHSVSERVSYSSSPSFSPVSESCP
eukprot:m.819 g.819  ORF g.819 m.819 type:complete len:526 (+) comp4955_c0_seq1:3-1580(+)